MGCKSVKRVSTGHSAKKAVLSLLICSMLLVLPGCASGSGDLSYDPYEGKEEASARIFNDESGYDDDTAREADGTIETVANAENGMGIEMTEVSEEPADIAKDIELVENIGTIDFPIVDNWPESIAFISGGTTAQPLSVSISIEEPMVLSVSCTKDEGKIGMRITSAAGKVYFDEKKMQTGDYTVMIDKAGEYTLAFYAREYYGKLTVKPDE